MDCTYLPYLDQTHLNCPYVCPNRLEHFLLFFTLFQITGLDCGGLDCTGLDCRTGLFVQIFVGLLIIIIIKIYFNLSYAEPLPNRAGAFQHSQQAVAPEFTGMA